MTRDVVFVCERLVFSEWCVEDFEDLKVIATDPRVIKYVATGEIYSDERIMAFIEKNIKLYKERKLCFFPLHSKDNNNFVGFCGLGVLNEPDEIEIGWWLKPDYWGKGLATEAAERVMTYAFEELNLPRLAAIAQPENTASINIMKKLGMTYTKMSKDNHGIDVVYYIKDRVL